MADRVSIAIRQAQALQRLNTAASRLAEVLGVEPPTIPTQGRDADLLRAAQFEALADWTEQVADNATKPAAKPVSKAKV